MKSNKSGTYWSLILEESSMLRHYFWKYRNLILIGVTSLLIVDALEIVPPLILKDSIDTLTAGGGAERIKWLALLYLSISIVQAIGRYMWRMFLVRGSMLSGRDMRQAYSNRLFELSPNFYDRQRVGDLMALATNDVEAVRMALGAGMIVFADSLFYLITIPIAMFVLSPKLTLIAFIPLVFIPFIVVRNEREIHKRFQKVQASFSHLASLAQEGLVGVRVVKSFAVENSMVARFAAAGRENVKLNAHLSRVQTAFGPLLDFNVSLGLVLLLYIGGESVIGHALSLGTFVAFQRYIQKLVWPMAALGLAITHYQRAVASSKRLKNVLHETPQIPLIGAKGAPLAGKIEFRDLTFSYPGAEKPVLKNISFAVEKGSRVALFGSVGSGKSTLLSLLPRLYAVPKGMIFIDGIDINDWAAEDLREQIGFVAQDVFLFSESVLENVAFGLATHPLDAELVTKQAAVFDEILRFPDGFQTKLGERGVNVSGGQKQRLSIARALMRKPSVLILDDALSAVDFQTEEKILTGLKESRAAQVRTEIISAHRISTVQDADEIIVLSNGEILQRGTHHTLLSKNGLYRQFYDQQRIQEELDAYISQIEV